MCGWLFKKNWLEVANTNHNPKVIAYYFLNAIKKHKCVPTLLRSDNGTENVMTGSLQVGLRYHHKDSLSGNKSYIWGKSTKNQRIESYWGRMRHHSIDYFIKLFYFMRNKSYFNFSKLHIKCLQYCFGPLIKYELHKIQKEWNSHTIRKQKDKITGKLNSIYFSPESYNLKDYKKSCNHEIIDELIEKFTETPVLIDPKFTELVNLILPETRIPLDIKEAFDLYKKFLKIIEEKKINFQL